MSINSEALCLRIEGSKLYIGGTVTVSALQYASIVVLERSSFNYRDHIAIQAAGYKFSRITNEDEGDTRIIAACASSLIDTLISVHYMTDDDSFNSTYFAV